MDLAPPDAWQINSDHNLSSTLLLGCRGRARNRIGSPHAGGDHSANCERYTGYNKHNNHEADHDSQPRSQSWKDKCPKVCQHELNVAFPVIPFTACFWQSTVIGIASGTSFVVRIVNWMRKPEKWNQMTLFLPQIWDNS